jgi:uncharacterized protein (TIGR03067 family)
MQPRHFALIVAAAALVAADDKNDDNKKELKKLEGSWKLVREETAGSLLPEDIRKENSLLIEDDKIYWVMGVKKYRTANLVKLDPKADPKTIDIEYTLGSFKDQKWVGIYKLDGDKLEICWAEPKSEKRPQKFATKPGIGNGHIYSKYERVKD